MASSNIFFEALSSFAHPEHVRALVDTFPALGVLLASHNLRPVPAVVVGDMQPKPELIRIIVQSHCCKASHVIDWTGATVPSELLQDQSKHDSRLSGMAEALEGLHDDLCPWRRQGRELFFSSSRVTRFRCGGQVSLHGFGLPIGEPLVVLAARARRLKLSGTAVLLAGGLVASSPRAEGPDDDGGLAMMRRLGETSLDGFDASDVPSLIVALGGFDMLDLSQGRCLTYFIDSCEVLALPSPPDTPSCALRCKYCGVDFPAPTDDESISLLLSISAAHRPVCSWKRSFLDSLVQRLPGAASNKDSSRGLRLSVCRNRHVGAEDVAEGFVASPSLVDAVVAVMTCTKRSTAGGLAVVACPQLFSQQLLQLLPNHPTVASEKYPQPPSSDGKIILRTGSRLAAAWEKYSIAEAVCSMNSATAAGTQTPPPSESKVFDALFQEGSVLHKYLEARQLVFRSTPVKRPRDEDDAIVHELLTTSSSLCNGLSKTSSVSQKVLLSLRHAETKAASADQSVMSSRRLALDRFIADVERAVEEESVARPTAPPVQQQPPAALPHNAPPPQKQQPPAPPSQKQQPASLQQQVHAPPSALPQAKQIPQPLAAGKQVQQVPHQGRQHQKPAQRGGGGVLDRPAAVAAAAVLSGPQQGGLLSQPPVLAGHHIHHHHHHHNHHHHQQPQQHRSAHGHHQAKPRFPGRGGGPFGPQ